MSKLKRVSIELLKNPEEVINGGEPEFEKYWSAPFIPLRATREAAELMAEAESGKANELELIDRMAEFVANRVYSNQFTVDDLFDRLHAPNALDVIVRQIQFVAGGQQEGDSKN